MSCFILPLSTLVVGLSEHGHVIGVMKWRPLSFFVINSFLFIFTNNITNTTSTQTNKTKQKTHTQYFKSPVKRNRERERERKTKQVIPEDGAIQSCILNMSLVSGHRK